MLAAVAGAGDVGQVKSGKDLRFRTGYLEAGGFFSGSGGSSYMKKEATVGKKQI